MTITVSVSDFRQNMSSYLARVSRGTKVIIKDDKKDTNLAEVIPTKNWDPVAYERTLRKVAGTFTAKNHPEWRTKRDVIRWVEKSRKQSDRSFDWKR